MNTFFNEVTSTELISVFGLHLSVASLVLRIAIGSLFAIHGYPKLRSKGTGDWLKSMGLPGGFGLFAGVVEFLGGIALLLGFLTQIIAALFVLWALALTWLSITKIKKKYAGGWELDITLLLIALALALIGGGIFSLDYLLMI